MINFLIIALLFIFYILICFYKPEARRTTRHERTVSQKKLKQLNEDSLVRMYIKKKIGICKEAARYNYFTNKIRVSHFVLANCNDTEIKFIIFHEYGHSLLEWRGFFQTRSNEDEKKADVTGITLSGITKEEWQFLILKLKLNISAIEYCYRKSAFFENEVMK